MKSESLSQPSTDPADNAALHPSTLYSARKRWTLLGMLCLISITSYIDRTIITVVLEPIKQEFGVSDTALGLLTGLSFAVFYATLGVPIAYWSDRGNRKKILTLALTLWSFMTVVCGLVTSFWQLFLARIGVGAGEAGAQPPAHSLIADYFPPDQRGRALSFFIASSAVGNVLGFTVGGMVAAEFGWRAAFIVAGAPGLVLALIARFALTEPRVTHTRFAITGKSESIGDAISNLLKKRAFTALLVGITLYFFVAHATMGFEPTYVVRVLEIDLKTMSLAYGLSNLGGTLTGSLLAAFLIDNMQKLNRKWVVWLPAIGFLLTLPIMLLTYSAPTLPLFLLGSFTSTTILVASVPALFTALHLMCGSARRTMAVAVAFLCGNLFGMGLGPTATGTLSDLYSSMGADVLGLRYALMTVTLMLIPSAFVLYRVSLNLIEEIED